MNHWQAEPAARVTAFRPSPRWFILLFASLLVAMASTASAQALHAAGLGGGGQQLRQQHLRHSPSYGNDWPYDISFPAPLAVDDGGGGGGGGGTGGGKRVEFHRWSASSTLVNMCSCEGPPDSILHFLDSKCEAVEIYKERRSRALSDSAAVSSSSSSSVSLPVVSLQEGSEEIFVKAFCTGTGEDVSVHLFRDENCTKRILRYSSAWGNHAKPNTCDGGKTFTSFFGTPVPTCASLFRCVEY